VCRRKSDHQLIALKEDMLYLSLSHSLSLILLCLMLSYLDDIFKLLLYKKKETSILFQFGVFIINAGCGVDTQDSNSIHRRKLTHHQQQLFLFLLCLCRDIFEKKEKKKHTTLYICICESCLHIYNKMHKTVIQ
jgi:hypothetical protein